MPFVALVVQSKCKSGSASRDRLSTSRDPITEPKGAAPIGQGTKNSA
jgi:hypothetical protein